MASPQVEDGYLKIANEIAEALSRLNLSAYQSRFLWALFRLTYGWNKKVDRISNSQIIEMTGMTKGHVSRTKKSLIERQIVTCIGNKLGFQKDYSKWQSYLDRSPKVTCNANKSYLNRGTPKTKDMKDNYSKEYPTKEEINESAMPLVRKQVNELAEELYQQGVFPKAHAFKNQMLKQHKNPRAVLHALIRCSIKQPKPSECWGYCLQIMKVEDGNYNERDYWKTT